MKPWLCLRNMTGPYIQLKALYTFSCCCIVLFVCVAWDSNLVYHTCWQTLPSSELHPALCWVGSTDTLSRSFWGAFPSGFSGLDSFINCVVHLEIQISTTTGVTGEHLSDCPRDPMVLLPHALVIPLPKPSLKGSMGAHLPSHHSGSCSRRTVH